MRHIFLIVLCIYQIHAVKESDVDLTDLFSDPDLLLELQKRLGNLLGSDFSDENSEAAVASVGCFDLSGTIEHDCNFHSNESTIIKTTESLAQGAEFLKDYSNITCATDCTAQCCANPECDTVVFQNKDDHNCYLFKCDSPSLCVFAHHHDNYWMSSISKEVHTSHSYTPGGATVSHENELENLGSHNTVPETTLPPTTQKTTITKPKPGLGDFCESYDTECNDTHSECFRKTCRCNGGYHERNGICRKHCRTDEFECDQIVYGQGQRQCVHKSDMCDGTPDCNDSSDEYSCQDTDRTGDRGSKTRPYDDKDTAVEKSQPHTDRPAVTEPPRKIMASTEPHKDIAPPKEIEPETRKPTTLMPTEAYKASETDSDSKESQASTDTDQTDKGTDSNFKANREPVSSESTENQSTNNDDSKNSNDSSNISSGETQDSDFQILNVESVKVESFSDSSQGPVVALALGLAITMMLLIFVGCRLRTVKRRLRKGRALHSNEADYLINGMYL